MEALCAETSVAELCRKHSITQSQFYSWNKEFMEAGKKRLNGDVTREATGDEVPELKKENARLTAIKKAKLKTKTKPILLSDNGPCYASKELKTYLKDDLKMKQVHGRPMHPQKQGKIERYHRTMKNVVKLNHFYHPEELIEALEKLVNNYNKRRYHESLNNLTPADVYYGRSEQILEKRQKIKTDSLRKRRQLFNQEKLLSL